MPRPTTDDRPIDCDLHPTVPAMSALMPYLDEVSIGHAIMSRALLAGLSTVVGEYLGLLTRSVSE